MCKRWLTSCARAGFLEARETLPAWRLTRRAGAPSRSTPPNEPGPQGWRCATSTHHSRCPRCSGGGCAAFQGASRAAPVPCVHRLAWYAQACPRHPTARLALCLAGCYRLEQLTMSSCTELGKKPERARAIGGRDWPGVRHSLRVAHTTCTGQPKPAAAEPLQASPLANRLLAGATCIVGAARAAGQARGSSSPPPTRATRVVAALSTRAAGGGGEAGEMTRRGCRAARSHPCGRAAGRLPAGARPGGRGAPGTRSARGV